MKTEPMSRPDPARDDAHDLLPAWLAATVPPLYATEGEADPTVHAKLFTPDSSWTWYLTEYSPVAPDGTPCMAFGLACGQEDELGYISRSTSCAPCVGRWGCPSSATCGGSRRRSARYAAGRYGEP